MFARIVKSIRRNMLVGLVLVTPIVATVLIFNFLFGLATDWMTHIRPFSHWADSRFLEFPVRLAILLVILGMLYLVGLLVRSLVGRSLYQLGDRLLTHIPVIKSIYLAARQISESLFAQRRTLFKEVVVIEYPRHGLYSVAFVTASLPAGLARLLTGGAHARKDCVSLFVPTTPNPTSGVIVIVPRSETIPLDIPVTEALTFVMSAGAVIPGARDRATPTLLEKLESWIRHDDSVQKGSVDASPEN